MRFEKGLPGGRGKMPKGDRVDLVGMLGAGIGRANRPPPSPSPPHPRGSLQAPGQRLRFLPFLATSHSAFASIWLDGVARPSLFYTGRR